MGAFLGQCTGLKTNARKGLLGRLLMGCGEPLRPLPGAPAARTGPLAPSVNTQARGRGR
jgi:hypothetical protein